VRPRVDPRELEVGIVHLGLGNFHRAHQAVYTEDAVAAEPGPWGICGAAMRRRDTVDALVPQDCLYTVLSRAPSADDVRVVGVIREALLDPDRLRARLAAPSTHIVTVTVTESGYDLAAAHLTSGFSARRAAGIDAPVAVVSCDNLPRNGEFVRERVLAAAEEPLTEWIEEWVTFPSSMVDRIVPAATSADRADASRLIGASDHAAVVAEPFSQWVLEDSFRGPRPAWERAGVLLVPDARPYEAMKLRLLNGSHSALAYLGLAAGHETVAEAIADPALEAFVRALIADELIPTLGEVPGIDLAAYVEDVLARFANPRIGYRLEQIAAGGDDKLPQRLLPPARELLAAGREPTAICRVLGAWLQWEGRTAGDPEVRAIVGEELQPLIAAHEGSPPPARAPRRPGGR
jgi:fructuronate reductase